MQSSKNPRAAEVRSVFVPQEYDLVRLIENVEKRHPSWDTNTPACEWNGILCCEKQVIGIAWSFTDLESLIWKYLPLSLMSLQAMSAQLRCELPLEMFPPTLLHIYLYSNKLIGNLDLLQLPPLLEVFDVQSNYFFGLVDFSLLPTSLTDLTLSWNSELKGAFDVRLCSLDLKYDFRYTNITVSNGCLSRDVYLGGQLAA